MDKVYSNSTSYSEVLEKIQKLYGELKRWEYVVLDFRSDYLIQARLGVVRMTVHKLS
jgi:hypothetical protein